MNAAELEQLAHELGIDVVGAAPAEPYEETERHIRDRRARGLFADMRFTMAQPEVSCHPEQLLPNARTVVGFYGKNTLLITRRFGSWVVLGTLVADRELETTPPLALDCGSCTLC